MRRGTAIRQFAVIAGLASVPLTAVTGTANAVNLAPGGASAHSTAATPRTVQAAPKVPKGSASLGAVSGSSQISGEVVLKPRDDNAVKAFIANVTNKKSPEFHHYLSTGEYGRLFGPTATTISATESALRSGGLKVNKVSSDGLFVSFSGSASTVESTFNTGLAKYRLPNGRVGQATTSSVKLPASIAPSVSAVIGLNSLTQEQPAGIRRGSNALHHVAATEAHFTPPTGAASACSDATAAATAFGGLTDDQIQHAYGADGLYSGNDFGAGQNVAIFELEPFDPSDVATFDSCYFGATNGATIANRVAPVTNIDGGQPDGPGSGESILDIEDVSATAPSANIHVYDAPNSVFGSIDEYQAIIDGNHDQEITTSWGECEQAIQQGAPGQEQAENLLFQQAAAQGQTVFSAAGDAGSDDCNMFETDQPVTPVLSVDDPSSQPYVVAAGGTTMDDANQPPSEHVWNDGSEWGAAGGGISEAWTEPAWQATATVPGINPSSVITAANTFEGNDLGEPGYAFCGSDNPANFILTEPCRELPDVSANSDEFTGGITIYSASFGDNEADSWTTIGGTSSAAPLWAGMLALINASGTSSSCTVGTGSGVGFALPSLYAVASSGAQYAASFNDITSGNNDPYGDSQQFAATTGYDMATGLGTPQLTGPGGTNGLAYNLCNVGATVGTRPTVTMLTPAVFPADSSASNLTITGTNFAPGSTVTIGDVQVPAGAYSVDSTTSITVEQPPAFFFTSSNDTTNGAGAYQVIVTAPNGMSSAPTSSSVLTFVDTDNSGNTLPTVTSVSSYGGPQSGNNTVSINGTGFTGATDVSFGGVSVGSGNFTVVNDTRITATVPAYSSTNTTCETAADLPSGESASNDVCQTNVIVTNANGPSSPEALEPLLEGDYALTPLAVPQGAPGMEEAPANSEYDYFATPTITSVSTDPTDPQSLASENGDTVITIKGTGLNLLGIKQVLIGDPSDNSSIDADYTFVSGDEIQIVAPPEDDSGDVPVEVQTLAGTSNSKNVVYAGSPTLASVLASGGSTTGKAGAPDTGGTPIAITGTDLKDVGLVTFTDVNPSGVPGVPPLSVGTQYNVSAPTNASLTTSTVSQNPAMVDVQVCSVTACSSTSDADQFVLFPPGKANATDTSPSAGPASGGTAVAVTGDNLGCVVSVKFGNVVAVDFSNAEALLDCGSTNEVDVTAPALPAGTAVPDTVPVTVTTVESEMTSDTPTTSATFTYQAVAPTISGTPPATAQKGHAYGPFRFTSTGYPAPTFTVSSGKLPPGIALSHTTGVLSGMPTEGGKFSFTVTAANGISPSATTLNNTIVVKAAPKFTKDSPGKKGTVGKTYRSYTFKATGFPSPTFKVSSGKLPAGLKLGTKGKLSGKPKKAGTYKFKVKASNGVSPAATSPTRTITIAKKK